MKMRYCLIVLLTVFGPFGPKCIGQIPGPKFVGLAGIKSVHGRYLQSYTSGEIHASNRNRNTEETWLLYEVDQKQHLYALRNWETHKYLSAHTNGCAVCDGDNPGPAEQWVLINGESYGVSGPVALKSRTTGHYLGALQAGQDTTCGGEVGAGAGANSPVPPVKGSAGYPGWWYFEAAEAPEKGRDFWNQALGSADKVISVVWDAIKTLF